MSVTTSLTLLEKVKQPNNNKAWSRFYDLYSPVIFGFAYQKVCSKETAEDVLQETMGRLWRYLPNFQYDPNRGKFSTYVCKIVLSILRQRLKHELPTLPLEEVGKKDPVDLSDPNSSRYFDAFEMHWKANLLHHAYENVKKRVKHETWLSYELFTHSGKSGEEVARQLGTNRNAIFQRKDRVFKLLQEEVKQLATEIGDFDHSKDMQEPQDYDNMLETIRTKTVLPTEGVKKRFNILLKGVWSNPPSLTPSSQVLVVRSGNSRWVRLGPVATSIGTGLENSLQVKSKFISKVHCQIFKQKTSWYIEDCDSTNGVLVNGRKVTNKKLCYGDIIQLGDTMLIFFQDMNNLG